MRNYMLLLYIFLFAAFTAFALTEELPKDAYAVPTSSASPTSLHLGRSWSNSDTITSFQMANNDNANEYIFGPEKVYTKQLQEGEPAYILEIQASKNRINCGENLTLDFYFSGAGNVDLSKIHISIPRYIVKDNTIEAYSLHYKNKTLSYIDNDTYHVNADVIPDKQVVNNTIVNLIPFNTYFRYVSDILNEGEKPIKVNGIWYPPVRIVFTVDDYAPRGDHDIYASLFFNSGKKWYVTNQVMNLHINQWYENDMLQYFVYIVIFIQIISFINKIWIWIKTLF